MKALLILLSLVVCIEGITQSAREKTIITITKTTPYCGGANPSEEILEEANKKKIPVGEKFYIIKGYKNFVGRKILDTLVIDSSGKVTTMLKPGCYSIINDFGYNKLIADTNQYDMDCLQKLWKEPLFRFKVIKGKSENFAFNITESCPYNKPCLKEVIAYPM